MLLLMVGSYNGVLFFISILNFLMVYLMYESSLFWLMVLWLLLVLLDNGFMEVINVMFFSIMEGGSFVFCMSLVSFVLVSEYIFLSLVFLFINCYFCIIVGVLYLLYVIFFSCFLSFMFVVSSLVFCCWYLLFLVL